MAGLLLGTHVASVTATISYPDAVFCFCYCDVIMRSLILVCGTKKQSFLISNYPPPGNHASKHHAMYDACQFCVS